MADRREDLLAAMKTALEVASVDVNDEVTTKPSGLNVYRHRAWGTDKTKLPDVSLLYGGEAPVPEGQSTTDTSERPVRTLAVCRAVATDDETADQALLPILAWAELAVVRADYSLGGVAANGRMDRIDRIATDGLADDFAEAMITFEHTVRTKWADPRQTP